MAFVLFILNVTFVTFTTSVAGPKWHPVRAEGNSRDTHTHTHVNTKSRAEVAHTAHCRELATGDDSVLAPNISFIEAAGIETWARWLDRFDKTQPIGLHLTAGPTPRFLLRRPWACI